MRYRFGLPEDLERVQDLAALPVMPDFSIVAEDDNAIIGIVGLELGDRVPLPLLNVIAVKPDHKDRRRIMYALWRNLEGWLEFCGYSSNRFIFHIRSDADESWVCVMTRLAQKYESDETGDWYFREVSRE